MDTETITQKKEGEEPSPSMGHLVSIGFNITEPLKMVDLTIPTNNLNVFIGANGTGKTFVLINVWALGYLANAVIASKMISPLQSVSFTHFAQFIWDHCFTDQNFNGAVKANYTSGAEIEVEFDKGKVTKVNYSGFEDLTLVQGVVYMSGQMRLFESISMYLKMRKMVGSSDPHVIVGEMVKNFKLFDVAYIEGLILKMPQDIPTSKVQSALAAFGIEDNILTLDVDLERCDFFVTIDSPEKRKYLSTYGNGHQALFNMFFAHL